MTTVEERLSRLEGVYDHLASKADVAKVETQIADLRAELKGDIAGLRTELKGARLKRRSPICGRRCGQGYSTPGSEMYRSSGWLALWQASWSWA